MNPPREMVEFEARYADSALGRRRARRTAPIEMLDSLVKQQPQRDPLASLRMVGMLQRWLADLEQRLVPAARHRGASWFEIGSALGRTRQAAWEKYRKAEGAT